MSVNLTKGQKLSLTKTDGTTPTKVFMGLGWDVAQGADPIDLDASCILFDANGGVVDEVWFRHLKSNDGSVRHSGDNLTGAGDGDDEVINVELSRVPANVQSLVFTVNSYRGQTFATVDNAVARLVDASNNSEIARYDLGARGKHTAMIMAKIYRHNGGWKVSAIGENAEGRTVEQLIEVAKRLL